MGFNTQNKSGSNTSWGECNCTELRCSHWKNWDMTQLPRITITDDMSDKDVAMFSAYNDNCEEVEDLWIELDLKLIDAEERASRKLTNRSESQRERDNRNEVKQLHKQGFSLAEIASITKLDHKEVYDLVHSKRKSSLFDDCPEEIMKDLAEFGFDLE